MTLEEMKKALDTKRREFVTVAEDKKEALEAEIDTLEAEIAKLEAGETEEDDNDDSGDKPDENDIEARIAKLADERLAKMKENMDKMAEKLAKTEKEKADLAKAQTAEKMAQLEKEGKLQELAEMKVAEANKELETLKAENTSLKRDNVVNNALSTLDFKNERSRGMARKDVVEQLKQDSDGNWAHTSGMTIPAFVEAYSKDPDNDFLFKVKTNTGGGKQTPNGPSDTTVAKKVTELSTAEILKLASSGKLGTYSL